MGVLVGVAVAVVLGGGVLLGLAPLVREGVKLLVPVEESDLDLEPLGELGGVLEGVRELEGDLEGEAPVLNVEEGVRVPVLDGVGDSEEVGTSTSTALHPDTFWTLSFRVGPKLSGGGRDLSAAMSALGPVMANKTIKALVCSSRASSRLRRVLPWSRPGGGAVVKSSLWSALKTR